MVYPSRHTLLGAPTVINWHELQQLTLYVQIWSGCLLRNVETTAGFSCSSQCAVLCSRPSKFHHAKHLIKRLTSGIVGSSYRVPIGRSSVALTREAPLALPTPYTWLHIGRSGPWATWGPLTLLIAGNGLVNVLRTPTTITHGADHQGPPLFISPYLTAIHALYSVEVTYVGVGAGMVTAAL